MNVALLWVSVGVLGVWCVAITAWILLYTPTRNLQTWLGWQRRVEEAELRVADLSDRLSAYTRRVSARIATETRTKEAINDQEAINQAAALLGRQPALAAVESTPDRTAAEETHHPLGRKLSLYRRAQLVKPE